MVNIRDEIQRAWNDSAPLTAACLLFLAAFPLSLVGLFLDHRIITGVPAWLKPSKFAISTAIFCGTMAWLWRYLTLWPRFNRFAGWALAIITILEVALIDIQAARGVTSHFNFSTPLDATIFSVMGAAIFGLLLLSAVIAVELFCQTFSDKAWGWALRLGMLITVLGAGVGGLMVRPTSAQLESMKTERPRVIGAHTVGAPDGGPGLPFTGWSRQHGDLRIAHFAGLHAIQIIPLFAWLVRRRRNPQRLVLAGAASYVALIAILLWQSMRGESIADPHGATLAVAGVWLAGTVFGMKG